MNKKEIVFEMAIETLEKLQKQKNDLEMHETVLPKFLPMDRRTELNQKIAMVPELLNRFDSDQLYYQRFPDPTFFRYSLNFGETIKALEDLQ